MSSTAGGAAAWLRRQIEAPMRRAGFWDLLCAVSVSLVVYLATRSGLFFVWPEAQLALVVGSVCGLMANRLRDAALGAAITTAGGFLVFPPWSLGFDATLTTRLLTTGAAALGAVAIAAAIWWLSHQASWARLAMGCAIVFVLVANVFATSYIIGSEQPQPTATLFETLTSAPAPLGYTDDNSFYVRVYDLMAQGHGYYASFKQAFHDNAAWGVDPPSVLAYRMPTVFWLWRLQPFGPVGIPFVLAALFALSMMVVFLALRPVTGIGPALAGVALLASYAIFFTSSTWTLWTEAWAVPFALSSLCLALVARRSGRPTAYLWGAAILAAFAVLTRELFIILPVVGVASALWDREARRRREWIPWVAALVVSALGWTAHALTALSYSTASGVAPADTSGRYFNGGFEFLWASVRFGLDYSTAGQPFVLVTLLVLGVLGLFLAPRHWRLLIAGCVIVPSVAFLLVGNNVRVPETGQRLGYWGPLIVPYLLLAVPWALRPLAGDVDPT